MITGYGSIDTAVASIKRGESDSGKEVLKAYNWPENIRELQNVINRAVLLGQDNLLTTEDLEIILHKCHDTDST